MYRLFLSLAVFTLTAAAYVYFGTDTSDGSGNYACLTFDGRLGNHVFQFASVYGIARRNNLTVLLARSDDLVEYFQVPSAEVRRSRSVCRSFKRKIARHCCVFDSSVTKLPANSSYVIGEYLQSWRYFEDHFDDVRRELTFKSYLSEPAANITDTIRRSYSVGGSSLAVAVGLHIRRGDLISDPVVMSDGVVAAPDHYILKAVDYFSRQYSNVFFIVCSDDMAYSRRVLELRDIKKHFIHVNPAQDMAILASCDHVIMTCGSFGWWSGFLSGGTVLYYKYPTREGTHARTEYDYTDYFPPHWIGLE